MICICFVKQFSPQSEPNYAEFANHILGMDLTLPRSHRRVFNSAFGYFRKQRVPCPSKVNPISSPGNVYKETFDFLVSKCGEFENKN